MALPNDVPEATKALIREYLEYDHQLGCVKWKKAPSKKIHPGMLIQDCVSISVGGFKLWYHRLVWFLAYGEFPDAGIIHRDGDDRNNRLENLTLPKGKPIKPPYVNKQVLDKNMERFRASLVQLRERADRLVGVADDARKAEWAMRFPPEPIEDDPETGRFRLWGLAAYSSE